MKIEDNTSKNWKNVWKEIRLFTETKLSAGIKDFHRDEQEGYVYLWTCVLEETELELEASERCLTDLGGAGYTTWIRKKQMAHVTC